MRHTTRQHVLEAVRRHGPVSDRVLALFLGDLLQLSAAAVRAARRKLVRMERIRFARRIEVDPKDGRCRKLWEAVPHSKKGGRRRAEG